MCLRRSGKHAPDQTRSRLRFVLRKQLVPEVRRPLRLAPTMPVAASVTLNSTWLMFHAEAVVTTGLQV